MPYTDRPTGSEAPAHNPGGAAECTILPVADKFTIIDAIDKPAAAAIPEVRRIFQAAFDALREAIGDDELAEAILERSAGPLLESDAWGVFAEVAGGAFLPDGPLAAALIDAARRATREPPLAGLAIDFDAIEDAATAWIEREGATLIRQVSDSTRAGVRQVIDDAFRGPADLRKAARAIADVKGLGLAPQESRKFERWVAKRMEAAADPRGDWFDLSEREIQRRIDREFGRRVRVRSRLIARTEAYNAGNEGRRVAWREAAKQGKLDTGAYEIEWVTRTLGVCPRCEALRGKRAAIVGGVFISDPVASGRYAGQVIRIERPTVHPFCYCVLRTRRKETSDEGT